MNNNEDKILFDPGYAPIVMNALGQVGYNYYVFCAIPDVKLKRLNFKTMLEKFERFLKTNVAFYLGCLMWASYIKQFENKELVGNQLLGEECEEKEYTDEINFLIDFVQNRLPRDVKYYQSKIYPVNEKYLKILETYKNFLIINKGFVACSNTNQIILPDNLKKLDATTLELINSKIQNAIKEKNVDILLEDFDLIF